MRLTDERLGDIVREGIVEPALKETGAAAAWLWEVARLPPRSRYALRHVTVTVQFPQGPTIQLDDTLDQSQAQELVDNDSLRKAWAARHRRTLIAQINKSQYP